MKNYLKKITMALLIACFVMQPHQSHAARQLAIIEIIKAAVVKAIKAVDLQIQRLQNKTIWLQNAQKVLENTLSKLKLDEISDWTEKQKEQYQKYYEELATVKAKIALYQRIKDITQKQLRMVGEYNRVWHLLRNDSHFTADEIGYMAKVYSGILGESLKNAEQITLVLRSFSLEMSDSKRLELINNAANEIDQNYSDLNRFSRQNIQLSLQRAKTQQDINKVKQLYGIQ